MIKNFPAPPQRLAGPAVSQDVEPDYAYSSESEPVHLRDYWKILVKRRRMIAWIFSAAVILGILISLTATHMYTATAGLKIEPQNPTVTGVEMLRVAEAGAQYDYYQTQYKLLESRSLAEMVVAKLGQDFNAELRNGANAGESTVTQFTSWIMENMGSFISQLNPFSSDGSSAPKAPEAQKMPATTTDFLGRYMKYLKVKPVKLTRLVEIEFTTPDPELSRTLANAHARGFIQWNLKSRFELTNEAREFLDNKNVELKRKLERSERELNRFRQEHGVVSMDKGENIVVERMVEVNKQLTAARAQRIEAESLYRTVENQSTQYLSQVLTQGLIPNLRASLLLLEADKVKLSTVFTADHPRIIELTQQIDETRKSLNREIANVVRGIRENYAAASTKERSLQAEADRQKQAALTLKEVGVQYAVLEEEAKVSRALYENVLKRLHETNLANDLAVSNIQIAQLAVKPKSPSSPNIPFNLLLSSSLGLLIGVVLACFLEYLDSTLKTPQHVWKATTLTTLGVVPDVKTLPVRTYRELSPPSNDQFLKLPPPASPKSTPRELIVSHHPLSILSESYRTIRTALLFFQAENPPRVVLLTSPSPGEGKTLTTLNLAIALAQDSNKVLVIDADLRKGCCHSRLGLQNRFGLSDVLTRNPSLDGIIQKTSVDGLSLISRGSSHTNPSDLLRSNRMRAMLTQLRETYDFILLDTPPVIAVSDAAVLSSLCDGILLVLHGQKTTTPSAQLALERLQMVRAPVLGVILNGVDLAHPDYEYYRHYYGSDYGVFGDHKRNGNGTSTQRHDDVTIPEIVESFGNTAPGTVSRSFVDRLIARFTEMVGPMAPAIVQSQIMSMGESVDSFPKTRLGELLEIISQDILDQESRTRFARSMIQDLQSFDSLSS
jgi:capsular exopolysaccharide synthesis family protein